jgi:hypothetical protein
MKKNLSILLILAMTLAVAPVFAADGAPADGAAASITLSQTTVSPGGIVDAVITVENMTAQMITVPLHFNPDVVKVVDQTGAIVTSGVKTAAEIRNGTAGVTTGEALDTAHWNGVALANPSYPRLDNENGFYRLLFTNTATKAITRETLITVRFAAVRTGDADIRFATDADAIYDEQSPSGVTYTDETQVLITDVAQNTQTLTVGDGEAATFPTQPPVTSGGNGSGGGGGGAYVPTVTAPPREPASDGVLTYEVPEALLDEYMSRAKDETNNSMNIAVGADSGAAAFVIKVPVPAVRKMYENIVVDTVFDTPIGLIGFHNYYVLQYAKPDSEFVIVTLSGAINGTVAVDDTPTDGLVMGFHTTEPGAVAFTNNIPVLWSRFDGSHLLFDAVAGNYTLTVRPLPFADTDVDGWAYPYIQSLVTKGILNGVSDTAFEPAAGVTREQFAKMLVSALDIYDESAVTDFADVQSGEWYEVYVASAVAAGIITGYEDGTFGTGRNITRQEMAVMLNRSGITFPIYQSPAAFSDGDDIADWSKQAVQSMQMALIIGGFEDGSFRPNDNATREQAAKMVYGVLGIF